MIEAPLKSPLNESNNITHLYDIPTKSLIKDYKKFNIDTKYLFKNIVQISAYKCNNTGYKFYFPPIEGDSKFYESCSKISWYYVPWKWEHEKVLLYINSNDRILEIGSGNSGFINGLIEKNFLNCTGLELNEEQVFIAKKRGYKVLNESIEVHAKKNQLIYDVVCSFQVLEHVYNVKSFIESSIEALKVGGKLLISVPNNGSYVYDSKNAFNSPPHHLGMWDELSLTNIADLFNLQLDSLIFEPIQQHHKEFFFHVVYKNTFKSIYKYRLLRKVFELTIAKLFFNRILDYTSKWIPGHTIIAVYTKKA
jgi:2-polyprenyl-3-methyl-5-hydroxy-6-metoxy-1,4-benzoquinol methylase